MAAVTEGPLRLASFCLFSATKIPQPPPRRLTRSVSSSPSSTSPIVSSKKSKYFARVPSPSFLPLYERVSEFRKRTAVCDDVGDFQFEDLYRRSLHLARTISDESGSRDRVGRVAFVTSGSASDLIAIWSIWMSGGAAVPIDKTLGEEKISSILRDAQCGIVLAKMEQLDEGYSALKDVSPIKWIGLDSAIRPPVKGDLNLDLALPKGLRVEEFYKQNQEALIFYRNGRKQSTLFRHSDLNAQVDVISSTWKLNEKSSVLHSGLPLNSPYGMVTAFLAPVANGGRVVIQPQFDTIKVWSHLLGIGVNTPNALPRVNLYPSIPPFYHRLLDRYKQLFVEFKTKDYVKVQCKQRLTAMINSNGHLPIGFKQNWHSLTGHSIVDCYTSSETGTVLSGDLEAAKTKEFNKDAHTLRPMPGVDTRLIKSGKNSSKLVGQLLIKSPGSASGLKQNGRSGDDLRGWVSTGDDVRMEAGGRLEVVP